MKAERQKRESGHCRQSVLIAAMTSILFVGSAISAVPVVESTPLESDQTTPEDVLGQPERAEASTTVVKSNVTTAEPGNTDSSGGSGTAYLLNMIEQMRQQMMDLQGQVEQQAFQIRQLQQDSRDRYLDLDERISRLNGKSAVNNDTVKSSNVQDSGVNSDLATESLNLPISTVVEVADAAEEKAYKDAFQLIRDKSFDQAQTALKQQLKLYPEGLFADNAQYWLGEIQMAQGQYPDARDSFQTVLKVYPDSQKAADANYKLGRIYDLLGNKSEAKKYLERVLKQYPDSAAARLSDTYLRTMSGS